MAELGAVNVRIGADTSGLDKGMSRAKAQINQLGSEARQGATTLAKYGAAATAAGVGLTAALVKRGLAAVDAQAKLATTLQTSVASMGSLERATQLSGISMGEASASAQRLTRRLSLAAGGTGPASEAIKKFGFNMQELMDMPLDKRIAAVNQHIRDFVPAAQQAGVASQFFGDRGGLVMQRLSPDVIAQAAREAELFGTAISGVDAAQVEAANDAFSTIGVAVDGFTKQLAIQFAPVLQAVGELFKQTAEEAGGMGNIASDAFSNMVDAASFVMNAVDGIKRVFQSVADIVIAQWSGMAAAVSSAILKIIQVIDSIPGVDMSGAIQSVERFRDTAVGVAGEAMGAISDRMSEPLAGDAFKGMVEQAKIAGRESAEASAAAKAEMEEAMRGAESGEDDPAVVAEREKQMERLNAIKAGMNQEFAAKLEHQERMAELDALFREQNMLSEQEFNELKIQSEQQLQDRLAEIDKQAQDKRLSDLERFEKSRMNETWSAGNDLLNAAGKTNEGLAKAAQVSGAAQAFISTLVGQAEALRLPFPANLAAVAKVGAVGFGLVNSIKGVNTSSKSGGGRSGSSAAASTGGGGGQSQQPQRQVADVTFNVSGGGMMRDLARQLVEPMNDLRRDGYEIGSVGVA